MAYIPVAAEKTIASLSHMKDGRHAREECVVVCGRKTMDKDQDSVQVVECRG
jgi:hypothetical protein